MKWDKTKDWFWEGNIQEKIKIYLKNNKFEIVKTSNTLSREKGPDILAKKHNKIWRIAVKGYPSDKYVENSSFGTKGKKKKTNPPTQARHWFSEALTEIILAKCDDPSIEIALGFPDFKIYKNLLSRISWLRKKLKIHSFIVSKLETKYFNPTEEIKKEAING